MTLYGYYNPMNQMLGFCIPVFKDSATGNLIVQEIVNDIICHTRPCRFPVNRINMAQYALEIEENDDAIYAIKVAKDEDVTKNFVVGDRDHVSDILKIKIRNGDFDSSPYTARNIGYFIGNKGIIEQAEKRIQVIEDDFFKDRPKPVGIKADMMYVNVAEPDLNESFFDILRKQAFKSFSQLDITDILIQQRNLTVG